ncbi:MAG: iron-containing alcohol dehydrogenase [Candidatus Limnocylindrales bacterium]
MQFEFVTATRIVFGPGCLRRAGEITAALGSRGLLVTGASTERAGRLAKLLDAHGVRHERFGVSGEPTVDLVRDGIDRARSADCDVVVGFGGGSAIDSAKAIAAMLGNGGDLLDHLEVIGKGRPLDRPSVPWIAIPTTAGTGSEVTRNAVLASPRHRVKASLRSPLMLARVALVDPELTYGLPPAVTASSGLDALTQLVEPFTSSRANPLTDAVCREGMIRAGRSLRDAFDAAATGVPVPGAREDMSLAALFGGLALANAGLGAVHGFAGPIGGRYSAPHGAVCGRLLPAAVAVNVAALRERAAGSAALTRYDEVARTLLADARACASDLVAWLAGLVDALAVPGLASYGMRPVDFPDLVAAATTASSMQANPVRLTLEELVEILARSL